MDDGSYFMFTFRELFEFNKLNDCLFNFTESGELKIVGECYFGNETQTYFDGETLIIGEEVFSVYELAGTFELISFRGDSANVTVQDGNFSWTTPEGVSCDLKFDIDFSIGEGCDLEWNQVEFQYISPTMFAVSGPEK